MGGENLCHVEGHTGGAAEGFRFQEVRERKDQSPLTPCPHGLPLSQLGPLDQPVLVLVLGSVRPLDSQILDALRAHIKLAFLTLP